jgi:hypothetical protein
MIKLDHVPVGADEVYEYYGDPDPAMSDQVDQAWLRKYTAIYEMPMWMPLSWDVKRVVKRVRIHKLVADSLLDALLAIRDYGGEDWLSQHRLNYYGGIYNFRPKRGMNQLSLHSFAVAIDLNPHIAPLGKPSMQPHFIVEIFEERGWTYGGDFKRPDGMHFQAARDY